MQEQFRQKMEHYFTKKYTQKDAEMRPELVKPHMIGKPVWYDSAGELQVEAIAKRCNVEPGVIRTNFENWKRAGGKPPVDQPQKVESPQATSLQISMPERSAPSPSTGGSSFEDDLRSTIETTRLLKEMEGQNNVAGPQHQDYNGIAAIISALKPSGGSETSTMALIAKMQENATARQQESFQQTLAMQNNTTNVMMQMMSQNTNMMLGLLQNQQKPATDSKLIDFALSNLMNPPTSVEDGLIKEFVNSGQAADVAKAIGDGVAGVMAARSVPTTQQPMYLQQQQQTPQMAAPQMEAPQPQPQPVQQQTQVPRSGPTKEEKCSALMQRFYDNLSDEFKQNQQYIEVLGRQVEIAIDISEESTPDLQQQMQLAERNMNLIVNLRPICTQVKNIADGVTPMDAAVGYLKNNPISQTFSGSDYDSLMSLLTRFTNADPPGQKMLAWDVEYLRTSKAEYVVKTLLDELNMGV